MHSPQRARVRRLSFKFIISLAFFSLHLKKAEVGDAPLHTAAQRGQWNKQDVVIRWQTQRWVSSFLSFLEFTPTFGPMQLCVRPHCWGSAAPLASVDPTGGGWRSVGRTDAEVWTVLGCECVRISFFFSISLFLIACCKSRESVPGDGHRKPIVNKVWIFMLA